MSVDFVAIQEVVEAARRNMGQEAWDYLVGGAESETTMRRNRLALDSIAFRPRVLRDVSRVDPSTTFLGHPMRVPVLVGPVGGLQRMHPDGAAASAKAASAFGTVQVVSSASQPEMEDVMAAAPGPKGYQLYIRGDWEWTKGMLARIKKAGYFALTICVDNPTLGRRERGILNRTQIFGRREGPRWGDQTTWDDIDRMKTEIGLPIMLKGIFTAEDAAIAVERGVDVVWVSNHGGRQLDHGQGSADMLPDIAKAVNGKATIVFDGGVVRGTDVLKALCLGANVVSIGKLQGWGVGSGGAEGMQRTLELLEEEIAIDMALLGVTSVKELGPQYLTRATPVRFPHEMSAWPALAENRLL